MFEWTQTSSPYLTTLLLHTRTRTAVHVFSTVVCVCMFSLPCSSCSWVCWCYPPPTQMFVQLFANKMSVIMSEHSSFILLFSCARNLQSLFRTIATILYSCEQFTGFKVPVCGALSRMLLFISWARQCHPSVYINSATFCQGQFKC